MSGNAVGRWSIFLSLITPASFCGAADESQEKSRYNLFHPTPDNLLRELATDRPYRVERSSDEVDLFRRHINGRPLARIQHADAGTALAHEHDAGATSAHSRPPPPRVASTRTQAPVGSLLCSLVGSFVPACGSDQTGSIIFADKMVPGGGNEVSEML